MNRSSSKADAANASVGRKRLRQLLHAFADAGQPSATGLQLLVGRMGFWYGQRRLRLIGQDSTHALCSLFRRSRRHRWVANCRLLSAPRSPRKPPHTLSLRLL